MNKIKNLLLNNEEIHVFDSDLTLVDCVDGTYILNLDVIVSEDDETKYPIDNSLLVDFTLSDGTHYKLHMERQGLYHPKLPVLYLACETTEPNDFLGIEKISLEDIGNRQSIGEGITIQDIRKVKMPYEEIELMLPIDQVEWLQNHKESNKVLERLIYEHMKMVDSK